MHIARLDGAELDEILTLDVPGRMDEDSSSDNVTRAIDLRAYGDHLAVGLLLDDEGWTMHLLDIDISAE